MNTQVMFIVMMALLAGAGWYANWSMRDKILVYYNRHNKTQLVKWVRTKDRYVVFDKLKFNIITDRIVLRYYNSGMVYMLFPQWVPTLFFSCNSPYPHDPNKLEYNAETPAVRKALNKEEWVESYYKGAKPSQAKSGKMGILDKWLPAIIALVAVGLVYWYLNNKMEGFGQILDQIVSKLPK